jgi:hypothetical protein
MSKEAKLIRGQLRQIAKEIMPEVLKEEMYKLLEHRLALRIEGIEKFVKEQMHEINENHKNTMSYLVRQVTSPIEPKKD